MYYVREYSPTCRFLQIINSTLTGLVDYFKNLQLECILHYGIYGTGNFKNKNNKSTPFLASGNIWDEYF